MKQYNKNSKIERNHIATEGGEARMKKIKQFLVMLLVISLSITSLGSTVFAASDFSSETQDEQITDSSQNLNVEGTDSVGDMLASVISEENNNSEERKQSANNITGLEIEDDTAVVEFQTLTDAEVVVAVYDEQRVQMLASGNEMVSQDENMATVTISGDMPQYFAATAYLLDADSHEPLCEAYNTELYTKDVQDLKNSTADDYDPDKVLQLDEDDTKTNFAVFNEETTVADEGADKNQLTDNGDGTYTITNADSSFTDLKVGDTFSYNYEDGTVLLVKVADISIKGTTVTVRKDTDTDLTDYFDYVKIETDEVQEDWNVDNSDLEEGVTAADSEEYTQASRIGGSGSSKYSTSWNIYKNLDENVTITGSFKYSFSFTIDVYITAGYQYLSVKDEYSAGIEVNITGTSKLIDIPLGRISTQPIICVKVELIPAFLVETSGSVTWSGEIKGSSGGAYDSNSGFKNLSSSPSCQSSLKVEGKIFMGVKVSPSVSIVDSDLANASLGFSGGAEIAASYSVYDTSKDQIHECKKCLKGEVKSKLSMELTVKLIKGKVYRRRSYDLGTVKTGDFYYSIDYDEFGWTTCPHVCYPVKISVTDKDGKAIKGTSTVRVADSKTGEVVEIRDKTSSMESVELTDSKETKVYLPNGSYIVRAVKDKLEGEAKLTVHDRGTQVVVKLDDPSAEEDSGKDGNITWRLTKDGTLYISGQGDMPDYDHYDEDEPEAPWKYKNIKKVNIEHGVTSIGSYAFDNCFSLESIKIPAGVTSIGRGAFSGCESLESIEIPDEITSIEEEIFAGCWSLENIKIPAGVTSIGEQAFENCENLKSIEIPDGVTSIECGTFAGCESLENVKIPTGVTSIGEYAFSGCESLKSIKIPDGVTSIKFETFSSCFSLESIEIPTGVTSIGESAFALCRSLESIEIPADVTSIEDYAFDGCESLESIEIPAGVTSIGEHAFRDCRDLDIYFTGNHPEEMANDWLSESSNVTIYYPQNDSTWKGIESESFGGTDIKWVPYDPASLAAESVEAESESLSSELQTEAEEFTDDVNAPEPDDIGDELFIEKDEAVPSPEPSEIPAQDEMVIEEGDTSTEESTDENSATGNEEITNEIPPLVSNTQEEQTSDSSMMFTDLIPYSNYLFVMVKDEDAENLLDASNLLYISQKAADETGSVSFRYMLRESYESPVPKVFGEQLKDIANTKVTLSKTSYAYDGKAKTPVVTVMDDDYLLQENEDYTITYSDNIKVGTATVMITGIGRYTGTVSASFTIQQVKKNNVIKSSNITKTVSAKEQKVKIQATVNDKAKLTYSSNSKSVKVNSRGEITIAKNFTGTAVITITAAETARYKKTSCRITVTVRPTGTSLSGVTNTGSGKANVAWVRNKSVTGYRIQYSTDSKFKKNATTVNISKNQTTKTTLSKLKEGSTYYVRIATYKNAGSKIYSSWSKAKKVTIRPTGTSLSGVTNAGNGKVKVTWLRNKSATGYRIQYSTDSKFKKNVTTVNISKNQTTKVTLSKLKKGKTYYVRIATYKNVRNKVYSSWSKVKKITIKK